MEKGRPGIVVPKGFLRRKFIAPKPPKPYVSDPLVMHRVDDLDDWRICLVSAPSGYGKTSLLAHWYQILAERDNSVPLWISLDGKDSDAKRLFASLATALQVVDQSFLSLADSASCFDDAESMATELANMLDESCDPDKHYVLMLDNASEIASRESSDWISFLAQNTDDNVKYVFCGTWISPEITDLLLAIPAVRVGLEDLALDEERMRTLAEQLVPNLSSKESAELRFSANGWPMELVFARLAAREGGCRNESTERIDELQTRYFEQKVTDDLEGAVYEFAVETSFLDTLNLELCDAVTQCECSRLMLGKLRERNHFVLYDESSGTCSYLPSFKRFLQRKWLSIRGSIRGDLARRAAEWCLENGMSDEHRKYLALSCDPYFLDASVSSSMGLSLPIGHPSLAEYLVSKPAAAFHDDPYLISIALWSAISAGFADIARDCVEAMRICEAGVFDEAGFMYSEALCDALEGDSEGSLIKIEKILGDESADLSQPLECLLTHMAAENKERLGAVAESRVMYQRALSLSEREDSSFYRMFDCYLLARQSLDLGKLDEAVMLAEQSLAECPHYTALYGEFNTIIAYVHIMRHQLSEAEERLNRTRETVSLDSNADIYVDTQVAFARLSQSRGDYVASLERLSSLVKAISGKTIPRNMSIEAYSTLAAIAAQAGDWPAMHACELELDGFLDDPDLLRAVPCMQAKAHILRAKGEWEACHALMDRCREGAVMCGSSYFVAQVSVFMAELHSEEGNNVRALVELNRALEISMQEGYRAIFLRGGPRIKDLLLKQATSRKTSGSIRRYAKGLLACFDGEEQAENQIALALGDVAGYYALTEREREILRHLNRGMSRSEIAEMLLLSENTVKTHLKNIYAKLGVHTRAEAYRASMDYESRE